jgi:hypothetical protein
VVLELDLTGFPGVSLSPYTHRADYPPERQSPTRHRVFLAHLLPTSCLF